MIKRNPDKYFLIPKYKKNIFKSALSYGYHGKIIFYKISLKKLGEIVNALSKNEIIKELNYIY